MPSTTTRTRSTALRSRSRSVVCVPSSRSSTLVAELHAAVAASAGSPVAVSKHEVAVVGRWAVADAELPKRLDHRLTSLVPLLLFPPSASASAHSLRNAFSTAITTGGPFTCTVSALQRLS